MCASCSFFRDLTPIPATVLVLRPLTWMATQTHTHMQVLDCVAMYWEELAGALERCPALRCVRMKKLHQTSGEAAADPR